jgi:DNA mismatch repair protein MSH6
VARVEQTETPEMLKERKKCHRGKDSPKVVNREVCSVLTIGTRTFCYLDDTSSIIDDSSASDQLVGPLLAIREVQRQVPITLNDKAENSDPESELPSACEYGICLVDAVRGSITIGQFADDVLRSRMNTLLVTYSPFEVSIAFFNLVSFNWQPLV